MTFTNLDITLEHLPEIENAQQHPLSPAYLRSNLLASLLFFGFIILLISLIRFQPFFHLPNWVSNYFPYVIVTVFLLLIVSWLYHLLADPIVRYSIREQDVSIRSGLIFRSILCQPILRIQHIEIKRGPLERAMNLASLHIFSAGGDMHSLIIPGLEPGTAQKLREYILRHKDLQQNG